MSASVTLQEAAEFLKANDHYLILSHRRPDGDTVGSCAALCRALRALGKQAWVYPNPQFTPKYAPFLDGLLAHDLAAGSRQQATDTPAAAHSVRHAVPRSDESPVTSHQPPADDPQAVDQFSILNSQFTVITCDIATQDLFPFGAEDLTADLAIDHHGTNDGFAARTHTDESKAACGELLTDLLPLLGVELTKPIADALYVAVSTDTGCFRYANVTAGTFRAAALCAEAGADVFGINRVFFETKRRPRLLLEAHLTEEMEFFADGVVAVSAIPDSLIAELGLTEDDIDDIAGYGRTVEGVEIAVMLREVEGGKGKISLRCSPAFDAARICARLGGGGHPGAAGASVPGGIPAAREAILRAIAEEIPL